MQHFPLNVTTLKLWRNVVHYKILTELGFFLNHIWGIYTFVPFVLGKGEFRNSSVNLAQLSALLKSEWTISLSQIL